MEAHSSLFDKMELEVDTNGISDESIFEIGDDIEAAAFENERCGICMDVIIDRGVLDCCQHWFCFACVDNWATITNLCPLCQNEFQSITCVPVYDTIGSSKFEDDSLFRDDDWCIQGKNNTLSFPSYYIDENAIICLDGDGCKIRNGVATAEEGSNLDTSIACDSCDIWYHAFCVGFDPESTFENSWLCPRCILDEVPQKSLGVSTQMCSNECGPETAGQECSVEATVSGKLSVSVADAGETAVVVSMIEGKQWIEEPSENFLSVLEINKDKQDETFLSCSSANSLKLETQLSNKANTQPNVNAQGTSLALSLSNEANFILPCESLPLSKLKTICIDKAVSQSNGSDGCKISSELSDILNVDSEPSQSESNINLQLGLSVWSSLSVDEINSDTTENHIAGDSLPFNPSEQSALSVDKMAPNANEDAVVFSGVKRKSTSSRDHVLVTEYTELDNNEARASTETEVPAKKAKSDEKSQETLLKCEVGNSMLGGNQKCSTLPATSNSDELSDVPETEATLDIMSIVQGTDHKASNGVPCSNTPEKSSKERDGIGLRVKKIMRRAAEDESSKVVEKLRKEIREAVRNKTTKDFSKSNLFDPKLLSAFRAAIVGPRTEQEPVKRFNPSIIKGKKLLLQKGKIRENLTKKIYGTTNGRRRRAWDRDWEIEFWKYRCLGTSGPEKVETLKSVLDLLRRTSERSEMEHEPEEEATNPILSRLYLADTSVFPRKDDIKPLSALTSIGNNELNKGHNLKEKVSKQIKDNRAVQIPTQTTTKNSSQIRVPSFDNNGKKGDVPSLKSEAACKKVHSNEPTTKRKSMVLPCHSKLNVPSLKEIPDKSDVKSDKRKWALEVLARKTAIVERDANQGKQEDKTVLKGKFPLLAQLPTDMKPILAASCHNKVPISVRQAQLYRLAEHFLRKANLPVIRRTADTELALADAVNIEKEVADRSSSKLVYINLCSQVLSQNTNKSRSSRELELNPSHESPVHTGSTESAPKEPSSDPSAEEALRMAGLVSDSPPNSPYHQTKDLNDGDDLSIRARDEGPENVFDMDTHLEMDIYGDFEYDLDDDYIGGDIFKVSKSQPEETDSKLKVVFSTLNSKRKNNDMMDSEEHEMLGIVKAPMDSPCELHKDRDMEGLALEVRTDISYPPLEPLQGEEPSLAECEELYGPDKEPLVDKFPDKAAVEPDIFTGKETVAENTAPGENGSCRPNLFTRESEFESESCAENIFVGDRSNAGHDSSGGENSPKHSLMSENVQRIEKQTNNKNQSDITRSISKKVEAYIKEHIRPLCKSGIITVEQYRWAVSKTTEKVMRYHFKDKNANFLIKEGEKVKKLAEQYVEAAQQKKERQ